MKYMQVYLRLSDVNASGRPYPMDSLPDLFSSFPPIGVLSVLSQLTSPGIDHGMLKKLFLHTLRSDPSTSQLIDLDKLGSGLLYSHQGLLAVWKWLLAHGRDADVDPNYDRQWALSRAILLVLAVSDTLDRGDSTLESEVVRNFCFNASLDIQSALSRAYLVFVKIAQRKELFDPREWVDFGSTFQRTVGCTLTEYLAIVFGLVSKFMHENANIVYEWAVDVKSAFSSTKVGGVAESLIASMSFTFDEGQRWARTSVTSPWDFTFFQAKPLFRLPNGTIFPVSLRFLYEQFFLSAYRRIRDCYSASDTSFVRFVGRPFEEYVSQLGVNAAKRSGLPYEAFPEFRWGKPERRSPDVMLRLGTKLLAVEAKSRFMRQASSVDGSPESIVGDLNRLVIQPLKQLHDTLKVLVDQDHHSVRGIESFYLLSVTWEGFPTLPPYEKRVEKELRIALTLPVAGYYHLDVREYELLCSLIERKNGCPIFRILDNKVSIGAGYCFLNFLVDSSLPRRSPTLLKQAGEEFFSRAKQILFEGTSI